MKCDPRLFCVLVEQGDLCVANMSGERDVQKKSGQEKESKNAKEMERKESSFGKVMKRKILRKRFQGKEKMPKKGELKRKRWKETEMSRERGVKKG